MGQVVGRSIGPDHYLPLLGGRRCYPALVALTSAAFFYSLPSPFGLARSVASGASNEGLFVVNLLFFAGTAAGCMIVATVASAARGEWGEQVSRIAEVTALTCLVLATMFFVLVALHHRPPPARADVDSLSRAVWDAAILTIYLGNALALGYVASHASVLRRAVSTSTRGRFLRLPVAVLAVLTSVASEQKRAVLGKLTPVMIPAAVLLSVVPAWVSALLPLEPSWYPVALGVLFYVSVLSGSLALVIVAAVGGRAVHVLPIGEGPIRRLGTVLGFAIPVLGYCLFAEMQFVARASDPVRMHVFHEIVAGPYAPIFWGESIAGVFIPAVLLFVWPRPSVARIGVAALLVSASVLVERWYLVIPAALGHAHRLWAPGGYAPSPSEIVLTLATYGIGFVVYVVAARTLIGR